MRWFNTNEIVEINETASKRRNYLVLFSAGLLLGLKAFALYSVISFVFFGSSLQSLDSYKTGHNAELVRRNSLLGYWLIVKVDGEEVYRSGKMMGDPPRVLRETLLWDETGNVVLLEIMGRKTFAYDVEQKRSLNSIEVAKHKFLPDLQDERYDGFDRLGKR